MNGPNDDAAGGAAGGRNANRPGRIPRAGGGGGDVEVARGGAAAAAEDDDRPQQVMIDDDHDDSDEDDEADAAIDPDGALDGGVAGDVYDNSAGGDRSQRKLTRSRDCPLVLFFECTENLNDLCPSNTVLRRGVTVSIGLDKTTKLSAVFGQYCRYANAHGTSTPNKRNRSARDRAGAIRPIDLEFAHCSLLCPSDTAESAALMKNDRVRVRRVRKAEREAAEERRRQQRESDRKYFEQLRDLLPDLPAGHGCDVILDCRGKLVDEKGYKQKVLATTVRAHSALVSHRCRWLGRIIKCARDEEEMRRSTVVTIPRQDGDDHQLQREQQPQQEEQQQLQQQNVGEGVGRQGAMDVDESSSRAVARIAPNGATATVANRARSDTDDDSIEVVLPVINGQRGGGQVGRQGPEGQGPQRDNNRPQAAEVEDDDEEHARAPSDAQDGEERIDRSHSPIVSAASGSKKSLLWVTLNDHPPEAVKLLLEYCYTNRVIPLGYDAFVQAGKKADPTKDTNAHTGPVSPFHHHRSNWPNNGLPTVSLQVALASIALAEEANMARFSLLCEVAASQLVSKATVLDVLSVCQSQQRTGNRLPLLRKAAMMEFVVGNGPRGVEELSRIPTFQSHLKERSALVVPSLLTGITEVLPPDGSVGAQSSGGSRGRKRDRNALSMEAFAEFDEEDAYHREMERKKWLCEEVVHRRRALACGDSDHDGDASEDDEPENVFALIDDMVASESGGGDRRRGSLRRMANQHRGRPFSFADDVENGVRQWSGRRGGNGGGNTTGVRNGPKARKRGGSK